jgi:DNA-binding transcriptional MerR regulator
MHHPQRPPTRQRHNGGMLLKVGELARQSGVTVRALHHYDEIGLLKPSGRSDAGYRLYADEDVARLHAIQALRQLGLALEDIGAMLNEPAAQPTRILEQQILVLERQIAQATELRDRLALIQADLRKGEQPRLGDWLDALSLMATYGKYFSAAELKSILAGFRKIESDFDAVMGEVRALMDRGAPPDSAETQALARRWMALVHHWMGGDFSLIQRWDAMYAAEPAAHGRKGGPPTDMVEYMQAASAVRMEALQRHFTLDELARVRFVPEAEWKSITERGRQLIARGKTPRSREARELARRWMVLIERLMGGDAEMVQRLFRATRAEPLLMAGSTLDPEVRDFLRQALDPHAA